MEQKRTGLSYVFTLAKEERGKLSLGMLLAVFSSALSFVPYLVVYQILLLIIKQEVTLPAMLGWAGIGIAAAVLQAILTSFAGICSHTAAFNTMHRIKVRVLEHMSKFNLGFFQEHAPGQIKTTLFDDVDRIATVYKGNIIKNLIMDCQSYTKYRPNETTGGIFVSWRRKEELPTGA